MAGVPGVQRRPRTTARGAPSVRTLDRGLRVLELLAREPGGLTLSELARRVGTHRTNLYRLLVTLRQHRLVCRDRDGRYLPGTGLLGLAQGLAPDLRSAAAPVLAGLAAATGSSAFLAIADGDDAVIVSVASPRESPCYVAYRVGLRHPLTRGASGIAILAGRPALPDERPEVAAAREAGYALTLSEPEAGVVEVAAPVRIGERLGEASVGVVTLPGRDTAALARHVMAAAQAIADVLC